MSAVDYTVDGKSYEGYFLRPKGKEVAPIVVIAHAWGGLGDNEREKAERIANLGYAAFAMDVYGKGKRGTTVEENQALMNPLVEDRAELQKRLAGSLEAAKQQVGVDESDREEKASLPSNYPSAPSSFTSRDDGENEEVGDEGGIEEKEEEEPDSVEAAVADLSQLMVQDEKEKEEGMGDGDNKSSLQGDEYCSSTKSKKSLDGGPIAIETKKI